MADIELKILNYGTKRKYEELQSFISEIDTEQLADLLTNRIRNPVFSQLWDYTLRGFTENTNAHKKRFFITKSLLEYFQEYQISNIICNTVIIRLGIEFIKFKSSHLVKLVDFCLECIRSGNNNNTSWKDLLPELLTALISRDKIDYEDSEISGTEFKTNIINSICSIKWSENILTSLAMMFIGFSLSKDEHSQVVNKLCKCMEGLTPQEMPSFVHQMLQLCKNQNGRVIFIRLQHYFTLRLYNMNSPLPDSETTDIEAIETIPSQDLIQAESTILFHIYQAASLGYICIKDYLNLLKILSKCSSYIINPFQLNILLSISSITFYSDQTIELVKYSISRAITEEHKEIDSALLREFTGTRIDIKSIFDKILTDLRGREMVVEGLINLAIALLSSGAVLGREITAEKQWYFGQLIIVKLAKHHKSSAPGILKLLRNKIITEQNSYQYIECIRQLCITLILVMIDNVSIINGLIEQLMNIPGSVAKLLVVAITPLVRVSNSVRDSVILILRKALFSKDASVRQMAAESFLHILKNMKVKNLVTHSQISDISSSISAHSILTQISNENYAAHSNMASSYSNEVLSLEIVNVLRRCFMLQYEVRFHFYGGLYDAINVNPELQTHILDMLLIHFNQYYVEDTNTLPPLNFQSVTCSRGGDVILQEPIGKLIFVTGLIVSETSKATNNAIRSGTRLMKMFDSVVDRMTKCELVHFELDDGTDLLNDMPDGQKKSFELSQILSIYEALIGYKIFSWDKNSDGNAQKILSLFKTYTVFLDFANALGKQKKAEANKRKHDDTFKKPSSGKNLFKFPSTILNLEISAKIVEVLHAESVEWIAKNQVNIIKPKREFHRYVMRVILEQIKELKSMRIPEVHNNRNTFSYITDIAGIVYHRCIVRLNDFIDFDRETAVLSVEVFYKIIEFVCSYFKTKTERFFSEVLDSNKENNIGDNVMTIIKTYEKLLNQEYDNAEDEQGTKKITLLIVNSITLLIGQLPDTHDYDKQVLEWCKTFVDENETISKNIAVPMLNLLCKMQLRCEFNIKTRCNDSFFYNIVIKISEVLGTIDHEAVTCLVPLPIINSNTVLPTLQSMCNILKSQLDDIDWIIFIMRAHYSILLFPIGDSVERKREKLETFELDLSCHVNQLIDICIMMGNIAIPPGVHLEGAVKIFIHLYNTLGSLTKYFMMRSSKTNLVFRKAKFERVVKLSSELSTNIYDLILFIEESQQQSEEQTQAKKKKVDSALQKTKVLRETRLIPKLIYEIEQFGKCVIQLSNKTKEDLAKHLKQSTSRDFRIKPEVLKEALSNKDTTNLDNTNDETSDEITIEEDTVDDSEIDAVEIEDDNSSNNGEESSSNQEDSSSSVLMKKRKR